MATTIQIGTSNTQSTVTAGNPPAPQVPEFLLTAGRVTKIVAGVFATIIGVGALAIGITIAPFSPEAGGAAIAFSVSLFALAGYLIYDGAAT